MATRQNRIADFNRGEPPADQSLELLREDHCGTERGAVDTPSRHAEHYARSQQRADVIAYILSLKSAENSGN